MRARSEDALCAALLERTGAFAERACRIDDVIDDDSRLVLDVADEVHDLGAARFRTALLDDGNRCLEVVSKDAGARDAAEVRRNDNDILELLRAEVVRNRRSGREMVDRDVEEALDLARMEVDRDDARAASRRHEVCDELCRNRLTAARLAVLTRIGIVRHDGRDAVRRGALAGICHDQELHEVVVHGVRRRLDDEDILAADALADHDLGLAIVEVADIGITEIDADAVRDLVRERGVGIAGQNDQVSSV